MKIALCLSGHARTYDTTYKFWEKNLLSLHNVDIFMNLWDTVGPRYFGVNHTEQSPLPREDFNPGVLRSPQIDVSDIIRIWNPTAIQTDVYEQLHPVFVTQSIPVLVERDYRGIGAGFEHHHPLSVRSMLYKRWMCNQLKCTREEEMGSKYDLVIQTRPDVALTNTLPDEIFQDTERLYFHNCRSETPDPEINDFACIGSSHNVDIWCNLYNRIDTLFHILQKQDNFFKFLNPHKMYYQYLLHEGINYKEMDIHTSIIRDTGIVLGWPHSQQLIKRVI